MRLSPTFLYVGILVLTPLATTLTFCAPPSSAESEAGTEAPVTGGGYGRRGYGNYLRQQEKAEAKEAQMHQQSIERELARTDKALSRQPHMQIRSYGNGSGRHRRQDIEQYQGPALGHGQVQARGQQQNSFEPATQRQTVPANQHTSQRQTQNANQTQDYNQSAADGLDKMMEPSKPRSQGNRGNGSNSRSNVRTW